MADLTRNVSYRTFLLNDEDIQSAIISGGGLGSGISGCVIDSMDISDVDLVQHLEKRSQQDGMDAGIPYLGVRRVRLAGTLYGVSRADLFDRYWQLRSALSPILSARESPADYGYQPFYFTVPTEDAAYAGGIIPLRLLAMPRQFSSLFDRDQHGGEDDRALAIAWQATLICKDPTIQGAATQDYEITAATSPVTGDLFNRGTYLAPVNALIVVDSTAGSIDCTIGDSNFTITIPASTGDRTIRFKGEDKVLTVEEAGGSEDPRMDLITFNNLTTWPLIDPTGVAGAAYSWTVTTTVVQAGSHFWFYERYA